MQATCCSIDEQSDVAEQGYMVKASHLEHRITRATPEVLISTRSFSVLQQPYESCPLRGTPIGKEITAAQVGV